MSYYILFEFILGQSPNLSNVGFSTGIENFANPLGKNGLDLSLTLLNNCFRVLRDLKIVLIFFLINIIEMEPVIAWI